MKKKIIFHRNVRIYETFPGQKSGSHVCNIMKLEPRIFPVIKPEPRRSMMYLIKRSAILFLTNPVIPRAGEEASAEGPRAEQRRSTGADTEW